METNLQAYDIRRLVAQTFGELGTTLTSLSDFTETLLIDEGRCAARSYARGDLMAMWLIGPQIVQFYDAEGNMLRTVNLFDEPRAQRKAA